MEIKGWAIKDNDGDFYWIGVNIKDWFHYDEKVYKATLTIDENELVTLDGEI
jgi:hypothetical protein